MLQPLSPGRDAAAPDSTRRGSGVPPGARTVLVVEDEPALRHFVRRALEGAGYAVVEAADGGPRSTSSPRRPRRSCSPTC